MSIRNLLALSVLVTCASTAAIAYDIGGDLPESKTQTSKETKRAGKGLFRHRKIAAVDKTTGGSQTPTTSGEDTATPISPK
jgi:hypothetical protein